MAGVVLSDLTCAISLVTDAVQRVVRTIPNTPVKVLVVVMVVVMVVLIVVILVMLSRTIPNKHVKVFCRFLGGDA